MSNAFVAVDTWCRSLPPRVVLPSNETISNVLIPKCIYLADIQKSFTGVRDAMKQVSLDAPRMLFYFDGKREYSVPERMGHDMLPLCTQAIMALPVELLFMSRGNIAYVGEPAVRSPLFLSVTAEGHVIARKKLDVVFCDGDLTHVVVLVTVDPDDLDVSIEFLSIHEKHYQSVKKSRL